MASGLKGKLVSQIPIKSHGDLFHELFRFKPHHISNISPANIQGCDLHQGEWGTEGSIIVWKYIFDGKERTAKDLIEAIDEENKSFTLREIEGDMSKLYNPITLNCRVDTKGDEHIVTWTLEYEKSNVDIPDPTSFMDFLRAFTKDIETHHLK